MGVAPAVLVCAVFMWIASVLWHTASSYVQCTHWAVWSLTVQYHSTALYEDMHVSLWHTNAVRSFRTHQQSAGLRGKGFLSQRLQFGTLIVLPRFTYNDSFTRLFVFVETVSLLEMLLWNVEALSAEAERCRRSLLERR